MKNLKNVMIALMMGLVFSVAFTGCSKDKTDEPSPSGNLDEEAAARVIGTYKGTIHPIAIGAPTYFNAILVVTKVSGTTVKVAPKSGEAYSGLVTKTVAIQGVLATKNALYQGPEGTFFYQDPDKSLAFQAKETAAGDKGFSFEGTKQ